MSLIKFLFRVLGLTQLAFFLVSTAFASSGGDTLDSFNSSVEFHEFRMVNRRSLRQCLIKISPKMEILTSVASGVINSDEENITVTVSGLTKPSKNDWVGMISPTDSDAGNCPVNAALYKKTGDLANLPLLCHYPVKAATLDTDPDYLSCKKAACKEPKVGNKCEDRTCSASIMFHVINIRTDIEFVLFAGGFATPCILKRTKPLRFSNPMKPLYGHLSSIDSTATSMRLTWVSGSKDPQHVQYGDGKSQISKVSTFNQKEVCGALPFLGAAKDFGWHDPGFIHTAIMTGLLPSSNFPYRYGSDLVGWSEKIQARTPPAGGADEVRILAFGDMGKAPFDKTVEHFIQPGSISVTKAMAEEVAKGNADAIFHIGDISYATGFLVEWDYFLHLINPIAKHVSYMTAIGNHERDYINSGSVYHTPDSGGECGIPYEAYFPMPTPGKDKPWYSIEMGSVHFTVISTEHNWKKDSEQYEWMKKDMGSVNRSRTPWLIFAGHRPMYSTSKNGLLNVDPKFVDSVEPLLQEFKVDLAIFGHVHNYERMCAVYRGECKAMPIKQNGTDTYENPGYTAPVQAVIGMAGFKLDGFGSGKSWSLVKISKFGYTRIHAKRGDLKFEFVNSDTRQVEDTFRIIKKQA